MSVKPLTQDEIDRARHNRKSTLWIALYASVFSGAEKEEYSSEEAAVLGVRIANKGVGELGKLLQ